MSFPRLRTPRALLLGLLLVGGPSGTALAADDFERYVAAARRLYENLSYERALDQIQRARRISRGVEQDVTLGLYEGIILADLGRWGEARESFLTALLLQPDATLPLRVSPKVEKEFEAQRVRAREELVRLQAPPAKPGATPSGSSKAPPPVVSSDRPVQPPPRQLTPSETSLALTPTAVETEPRRVPVVPLALLGAGVVAGGLGAYFGVSANGQLADARVVPLREDALAKFNDAHGSARTANILFGTAGLAVASAVVTWFLLPGDASSPASSSGASNP
ncbi:tetratricopeptide repeat protein [Archangium lipolyticum]|uniref:tetratricopeptide repeat protein n=1 Tax=Archangium lipolyticum TaxID=2970465 RepID=UPI00214A0B29|nr:tetratricopeptide repeat protein [Archangium lipolyticum]